MAILTVSQFTIPKEQSRICEPLLSDFPEKAKNASGFISTSVWRKCSSTEMYLRLTAFETQEDSDAFYDGILKSDALVEAINKFGLVPDVTQFRSARNVQVHLNKVHESEFMSLSMRSMDPGMEGDWIDKLENNFREVSMIGGFEGAIVGLETDSSLRVLGLAFWQTEEAFKRSVPSNPDYEISVFSLYR